MKYNQELLLEIKTQYGVCKVYKGKEETIQADLAFNLWKEDDLVISSGIYPNDDISSTINNLNFRTSVEIIRKGESVFIIDDMTLKFALKDDVSCEIASFDEDNILIRLNDRGVDIDITGTDKWVYFDYDAKTFGKQNFDRALVGKPYLCNLQTFRNKYKDLRVTDTGQINDILQRSYLTESNFESFEVFKLSLNNLKELELRHEIDDEEFITIYDLFAGDLDFIYDFCAYTCKDYVVNIYFNINDVQDANNVSLKEIEEIALYVTLLEKKQDE